MNKIYKLNICLLIMFIALSFSSVFAVPDVLENTFKIDIANASERSTTIHYKKLPFYINVSVSGAYEVSMSVTTNEAFFRLVDSDVSKMTVYLDRSAYGEEANRQVEVTTQGTLQEMAIPSFEIYEHSDGDIGNKKKIYNVSIDSDGMPSGNNVYFFSSSMQYEIQGYTNTALNMEKVDKNSIEGIVTRVFLAMGDNLLLKRFREIFGNNLSVNTLIFNQFEPTRLDLYQKSSGGTTTNGSGVANNSKDINGAIRDAVNEWFNKLLTITLIAYIIILLYIGIMIITSSGTPRQGKAKQYFTDWVVGLVILIFVPRYGFPLIFDLNDALVAYIGKDAASMETYYTVLERRNEIVGGDSMTVAIQKLEQERDIASQNLETTLDEAKRNLEKSITDIIEPYFEGKTGKRSGRL